MQEQIRHMKNAYAQLYEIENTLRLIITSTMETKYGANWYNIISIKLLKRRPHKEFINLNFHELITLFRISPELIKIFPINIIKSFPSIYPIRNKIAHCKYLNDDELLKLNNFHLRFINVLSSMQKVKIDRYSIETFGKH
ncbi:hypothetical protein LCY76_02340 [Fictibacillus sp. KIGAM418]|uniref:Swt1-like HEPN domain-containing protein n=1 Tax=Fictibacillus marinisediminis TaxID=2878389 RepID=A0A9X1XCQ8_9BACL|nr:hypothetical protein [Fictibacillus marinisediminis]MCK6255464.1 hypothetical protein [Fictibacillus marinisediminis]